MIGKKFNYGWVIVGYGVLCMLLLHYGTVGSQAIFLLPVTQDLGVSTTTLTMASTYGTIVSMIVTPWAGKLMDKKSIRRLMFFGILGTGLTMVAQSYVASVYTYYAIILVRTALNPFALMMPFAALAARWFTKENRSFATSIIFVGISLGGVLLSNPLAALIETVGWRLTYRYYGLAAVVLLSPLTLALVRDYPDGYEEMIQEETVGRGEQKADLVSLLKDRRFILVCAGMSCISFIGCSLYHISSYVQSLGYDARFGATVISIYNFVCIFSKMIMGRLFDLRRQRHLRHPVRQCGDGLWGLLQNPAVCLFRGLRYEQRHDPRHCLFGGDRGGTGGGEHCGGAGVCGAGHCAGNDFCNIPLCFPRTDSGAGIAGDR